MVDGAATTYVWRCILDVSVGVCVCVCALRGILLKVHKTNLT